MKKYTFLLLAASATIFFISCQREVSVSNPATTTPGTLNDFVKQNRAEATVFSGNNSSDLVFTTSKGTKLFIPANAFTDASGNNVSGTISISLKEIITPQEMIFNDMPTVSNGRLLESGGEYNITAKQNGAALKLKRGNVIRINIPANGNATSGMQVFNGKPDANGNVNWVINSSPVNVVVGDSTLFSTTLSLFCDSINWINCDRFINDPTVQFSVLPGNAPSADSTNVFIHLTGRNTLVKMDWTQGLNYFTSNTLLPVASTIVGISKKNGQFYASVIPVTIQNGGTTTLSFTAYSEAELKQRLSQLR